MIAEPSDQCIVKTEAILILSLEGYPFSRRQGLEKELFHVTT